MVDISDVIRAFSEWEDLEAAIGSVNRQTRQTREIIVVIDHNEKLLAQVRWASAWPDVLRTIEGHPTAPGGGGGWSSGGTGVRMADARGRVREWAVGRRPAAKGFGRPLAILLGLAATTAGYASEPPRGAGSCAREPRPRTGVVPAASDDC